jgi:hypothetical protein
MSSLKPLLPTQPVTASGLKPSRELVEVIQRIVSGGGASAGSWGSIGGTLSDQTDLQTALDAKLPLAGGTMTGRLVTAASGATAGLNIAVGTVPGAFTDGDIWITASSMGWRINGTSYSPVQLNGSQTITGKKTFAASTTGGALLALTSGVDPTTPSNGDAWYDGTSFKFRTGGATSSFSGVNTGDQFGNVTDQRLLGRAAGSAGAAQEITVGDGFRLASGALDHDSYWIQLSADYTLSNSGSTQKLFNTTANGSISLPTGFYLFQAQIFISTMSATSGNAAFDPLGAGTAVISSAPPPFISGWGFDNNNATDNTTTYTGSMSTVLPPSISNMLTAGTGSQMQATIMGQLRVTTTGTLIPSIKLTTAAAAVAKAGTYFHIQRIGASGTYSAGGWT